jgi:uncharacterized protein (DUF1919 family)
MRQVIIDRRNKFASLLNRPADRFKDCTVISNDCWGGSLYQDFGWEYRTPFVGLAIMAPCYIRMISDLEDHMKSPLRFKDFSKYKEMDDNRKLLKELYPIGVLGDDLEIHFFHYQDEAEARAKWERRVKRINWSFLAVKFSVDKDYSSYELLQQFDRMHFARRIAFSKDAHPELQHVVQVSNYLANGAMLYRRSICQFDLPVWLESGKIFQPTYRTVTNKLLFSFGA